MKNFFNSLFSSKKKEEVSGQTSASRMRLMLTHDRQEVSPGIMEEMKAEIIAVIQKYFDIDPQEAEFIVQASHGTDKSVISSNIPIMKGVRLNNAKAKVNNTSEQHLDSNNNQNVSAANSNFENSNR